MANTLDNNFTTINDGFEYVFGSTGRLRMGQFFKAGTTGPFSRASASLAKNGSPVDNLVVKIYNASRAGSTLTIGSLLGTSTTSYAGSTLPTYPAPFSLANAPFVDFDFDGSFNQVSGQYYVMSAERTGAASDVNDYVWGASSADSDPNGSSVASDAAGTYGTGDVGNPDMAYRTYYDPALATTTSTSSSISTSSTSSSTSTSHSTSSTSSSTSVSSTSVSTSSTSTSISVSTSSTSTSTSMSTSLSTSISTSTSMSTSTTIMALDVRPQAFIKVYR